MTKEDERATIAALLEERRGYENRARVAEETGDEQKVAEANERVAAVDAQLRALGAAGKTGASRATKRPSGRETARR